MPSLPRGCPVSLGLIGLTLLLYLGQLGTAGQLTDLGLLYGPAVQAGHWWRLVSSGFLHGSLLHVGFNMYLLYMLGPQLERSTGSFRFALIYAGALLGGSLAVTLFDWGQPTLGASGAVLGLAGAMGIALHQRGIRPQQSPVFGLVVLNLALPLLVPGISFWGHFGGVVAGIIFGYLMIWLPVVRARSIHSTETTSIGLNVTGLAAVTLLFAVSVMAARLGGVSGGI